MPAGCKTDPSLAEAEPISDGGSTSVTTPLREKNKKPRVIATAAKVKSENS